MQDVALSAQLQQWTFEKSRPERADSSASSPRLDQAESETLQITADAAAAAAVAVVAASVAEQQTPNDKEMLTLQDCYLSSEEDLSPVEGDDSSSSDSECDDLEVLSIHDGSEKECFQARKMSMSRFEKGKSCDLAVRVSYLSAGRPKVIELASPTRETPPQRSASLAELPVAAINKLRQLDQSSRLSLAPSSSTSRSSTPAIIPEIRRPSTGHAPFSHHHSSLRVSDSSSFNSSRSSSPAVSERSARPASVAAPRPLLSRSSLFISSSSSQSRPMPPPILTPRSPDYAPSFLSSDPYENSTKSAASPIIKSSPHRRLRSISKKLALARIAITPSTKKWDSRIDGRQSQMPPTPATPFTPMTPQTAPPTGFAPTNRLRRNSRFSRPNSVRGPSPEIPPVPKTQPPPPPTQYPVQRLVPRGADEREPILELPPCPDELDSDPVIEMKAKKVRKRKSLMDLLQ